MLAYHLLKSKMIRGGDGVAAAEMTSRVGAGAPFRRIISPTWNAADLHGSCPVSLLSPPQAPASSVV